MLKESAMPPRPPCPVCWGFGAWEPTTGTLNRYGAMRCPFCAVPLAVRAERRDRERERALWPFIP